MASIKWDHTVHYINDLQKAIEKFNEEGLIAFMGGSHKQWGTYNALSYFDLCYIEFLGVENRGLAESIAEPNDVVKDSVKLLPDREELSRVALRTEDIEEVREQLSAFQLDMSPIMDGKRLDAQGNLIEWKMMTIAGEYQGLPYPFVIQWMGADQERRERLKDSGIIQEHPVGDVRITEAVFDVEDPEAVAKHWQELFGFERKSTGGVTPDSREVKLAVGDQTFVFKQGRLNRLQQLLFHTAAPELKGKTMTIGEGEYTFA
ncbi:Glyoxalase-like domain-containing protein [Evansella caseinilytica]|uniref:Glyoxalase-like domain-containing protein n=1 Tax=Evansella caseinilytica TaxID=1503961 RepID=A0A1H3HKR5_9BACI|nr:VOC family protein [Evansella caseinilytica]SDY15364.1 Glyoxalase-like domain-containing protein [Evansella caseinilytica]